jgi:hypothetical protein
LSPGNPLKIVKGTEIDTEFNNIATAIATKTDNSSATITGGTINGATIGASTAAAGTFTNLTVSSAATIASAAISAGTINGAVIGGSSAAAITGTNVTATTGFSGPLTGAVTGNVTGNLTGNVTGNVTGNITGNVTGNVTAASGTSTFNNVTISGSLDMDSGTSATITGLASPTNDSDAATKGYVDALAQGIDAKASVVVATTANITLSGTQTIDGVAVSVGDRVLVKDQSTASQNGIYLCASSTWTRTTDADSWTELVAAFTFVEKGTTNADSGWVCTVDAGGTLGSTSVTFAQFSGAGQITAGAGLTKTGNTIDVGTASSSRIVVNSDNIDLATSGVTAGTYKSVTADAYGRITAGTNPTSISGFGITDAYTKTEIDSIFGSTTSAATSASNAATSASNAATSASSASTSATNAASSATSAAASYDAFDDRYLGSKSSAPTLDNDGNALLTGALYWNTTVSTLYVYTGSAWTQAAFTSSGFLTASNNLSDVASASTARSNLGLAIGTNVQAWDADLDTWATKTAPSGTVVGTSDTQTLTNKTLTTPTLTTPNITTGLTIAGSAGTSGQVLTSAGSGAAPTWSTPSAGAMTLISTQTASSSASIGWTGLSGYSRYILILDNIRPATANAELYVQIGTGATPTYVTTGYSSGTNVNEGNTIGFQITKGDYTTAAPGLNATVTLISTAGSYPGYTVTAGWYDAVSSIARWNAGGGRYNSTATITAFRLIFNTGNISAGTASLYGISS